MVQHAEKQQSDCYVSAECLKCKCKCKNATENASIVFVLRMYVHLLFNLYVDFKFDI